MVKVARGVRRNNGERAKERSARLKGPATGRNTTRMAENTKGETRSRSPRKPGYGGPSQVDTVPAMGVVPELPRLMEARLPEGVAPPQCAACFKAAGKTVPLPLPGVHCGECAIRGLRRANQGSGSAGSAGASPVLAAEFHEKVKEMESLILEVPVRKVMTANAKSVAKTSLARSLPPTVDTCEVIAYRCARGRCCPRVILEKPGNCAGCEAVVKEEDGVPTTAAADLGLAGLTPTQKVKEEPKDDEQVVVSSPDSESEGEFCGLAWCHPWAQASIGHFCEECAYKVIYDMTPGQLSNLAPQQFRMAHEIVEAFQEEKQAKKNEIVEQVEQKTVVRNAEGEVLIYECSFKGCANMVEFENQGCYPCLLKMQREVEEQRGVRAKAKFDPRVIVYCCQFDRHGHCWWGDTCKYSHSIRAGVRTDEYPEEYGTHPVVWCCARNVRGLTRKYPCRHHHAREE